MKKYEAILLSYQSDSPNPNPSKKGFNTEEEAWGHIKKYLCEDCLKSKNPAGSSCAAEWMVDDYESDEETWEHIRKNLIGLDGIPRTVYIDSKHGKQDKPHAIRDDSGFLLTFTPITYYSGQVARYEKELKHQQFLAEYLLQCLKRNSL